MPASLARIVWKKEPGEQGIAAAEIAVPAVHGRCLPIGLCLAQCSSSVTSKKLALGFLNATDTAQRPAFQFGGALKVGGGDGDVSKDEVRRSSKGERKYWVAGERNRALRVLEGLPELPRVKLDLSEVICNRRFGLQPLSVYYSCPRPSKVTQILGEHAKGVDEAGLIWWR